MDWCVAVFYDDNRVIFLNVLKITVQGSPQEVVAIARCDDSGDHWLLLQYTNFLLAINYLYTMLGTFLIFLAIAFTVASWSSFIDECLQEGDIFDRWGKVVKKEIWHNQKIQKKLDYLKSCCQATELDVDEYESKKLKVPKWKMPLGGCVVCTNTWWTILTSFFYFLALVIRNDTGFTLPAIIYFFIQTFILIALSNTFLKYITK